MAGRLALSTPGMEDRRLRELRVEEWEVEERFVGVSRVRSLVEERPDRAWRFFLEVDEAGFLFLLRVLSFSLNGSMAVQWALDDVNRAAATDCPGPGGPTVRSACVVITS